MRDFFSRENLWALCFLLLSSSSSAPHALWNRSAQEDASPDAGEFKERLEATRRLVRRLLPRIEREIPRPGRLTHDIHPTAVRLGFDPERIFVFVRDKIRNEPYAGIVRGSRGVLMSGGGNPLEKSILLCDLLKASGVPARLVRGKLPPDAADAFVDRFLRTPPEPPERGTLPKVNKKVVERIGSATGTPPADAVKSAEASFARRAARWRRAWELTSGHEEILAASLSEAGAGGAMDFQDLRATWTKNVSDHFWAEYRDPKTGRWTPLEPGAADARPGTLLGREGKVVTRISNEWIAWLKIVLVLDRVVKGAPEKKALLEVMIPASLPLFEPIHFSIGIGEPFPPNKDPLAMNRAQLFDIIRGIRRFQAVLDVGMRSYPSQPFDLEGGLYDVGPGGELKDLLGGISSGADIFGLQKKTRLRALTLKLTLMLPGRRPVEQERRIYDGASRQDRPHRSVLSDLDIFLQPHWVSREFTAFQEGRTYGSKLRKLLSSKDGGCCDSYPLFLLHFARMRQYAIAKILETKKGGVSLLWDTPSVILRWTRRYLDPAKKEMRTIAAVDIFENRAPFVPTRKESGGDAWRMNLRLGVFDSCYEGVVLAGPESSPPPDFAVRHFERARMTGVPLLGIPPNDRERKVPALFSKEDAVWIGKWTPRENALAVSAGGPGKCWWSIDTPTGSCVARVSGGGGEAAVHFDDAAEYTGILWFRLSPAGNLLFKLVLCFLTIAAYLTSVLRGNERMKELGATIVLCALSLTTGGIVLKFLGRRVWAWYDTVLIFMQSLTTAWAIASE